MLRKLTLGLSIVLGLALGTVLGYHALRVTMLSGLKVARGETAATLAQVEARMQRLSDLTSQAHQNLARLGNQELREPEREVQELRARLRGTETLEARLALAESLETALFKVEDGLLKAGKVAKVNANYWYQEHGRIWVREMRWLSKEQAEFRESIQAYNRVVSKWPASWFAKGYSIHHMAWKAGQELKGSVAPRARRAGQLVAWQGKRLWAKLRKKEQPAKPAPAAPAAAPAEPVAHYTALYEPRFTNQAPWPEEFYNEVQYRKGVPMRAVVNVGDEKPVLERQERLQGFKELVKASRSGEEVSAR